MSAKWTFMVYVAGYGSRTSFAGRDIAELRKVGSGEELQVTVFVRRLEQQAAHRMVVGKDEQREDLDGAVDAGSPQTLVDFIAWSKAAAPADRYALILSDHGWGWDAHVTAAGVSARELDARAGSQLGRSLFRPTIETALSQPDARRRAIASGDGTGHALDTLELGNVLEHAHELLGRPLDLLGLDGCLMSGLEVAYQAEKDVRAVVCSEALEPGDGWPYEKILTDLRSNPTLDGAGLGRVVVRRYVESYKHAEGMWPVTMCAIHSAGIAPFAEAFDAFTLALRHALEQDDVDGTRLLRAHTRSMRFDGDLVDLRTLCEQVRAQPLEGAVKAAAKRVLEALKPGGDFVVANANLGESTEHCGGVTAYLPSPTDAISPHYKDLRFAQRHGWDELLRTYRRAVRGA